MSADLEEVKQIKAWHYLLGMAASAMIPFTVSFSDSRGEHPISLSRTFYVGFPLVFLWVMKTFDLNPGRALARGKWVLLAALAAGVLRSALETVTSG
ncbi:MAG: hypothetical protein JNJ54_26955 [Myxococcaceae bacterium]|nr:hypothetical protein [Myxococcaceae bacterium]